MAHAIESLLTQKELAAALKVCVRWLRDSDCPKVLLPGNGPKGKPMVRYRLDEVKDWLEQNTKRSTLKRAG